MDTVTAFVRSRIMARVKATGNKSTERALISIFRKEKISGWRRNSKLIGKPDVIFPKKKIAIFVDGCLWHGCARHCRVPQTNRSYWTIKIAKNKARDLKINKALRAKSWVVIRIWEHEIKTKSVIRKIKKIKNNFYN